MRITTFYIYVKIYLYNVGQKCIFSLPKENLKIGSSFSLTDISIWVVCLKRIETEVIFAMKWKFKKVFSNRPLAQSAGALEYTDCISAEGRNSPPPTRVQCDSEVPVMLWKMRSSPLLPSLPCPFCSGVVAPEWNLSIGEIELNSVLMLNWITWNRTVFKFNCV